MLPAASPPGNMGQLGKRASAGEMIDIEASNISRLCASGFLRNTTASDANAANNPRLKKFPQTIRFHLSAGDTMSAINIRFARAPSTMTIAA